MSSSPGRASSLPSESESASAAPAQIARLKRQLVATENKLVEVTNTLPRKKPQTQKNMGRGIRRLVSLYENLTTILDEADRRMLEEENDTDPEPLGDDVQRIHDRTFTAYSLLLRTVPQLKTVMQDPDITVLSNFLSNIQEGANGARTDDNKRIKEEVANMVNSEYSLAEALRPKTRHGRGLQHDVCGQLLAPIEYNWHDPEVRAKIRDNDEDYSLGGKYFVRCLYQKGCGDAELVERGFLRSRLLLQVYCSIFTSPSSAEGFDDENDDGPVRKKHKSGRQKNSRKSNVAKILNMNGKVTGRSIAYAAVLLVFNLTDAPEWQDEYNGFSFVGFYNFLVDYFEEKDDAAAVKRVDKLLSWWKHQVFPDHVSATADGDDARKKLKAQRARAAELLK